MNFKHNIVRVTAIVMAGMITAHGWGSQEVADQPHVEIDIQPPRHVRSTVITVSGSQLSQPPGL